MARNAGIAACVAVVALLGWLWWVVPEGRERLYGPQSGDVAATVQGAIENALVLTGIFLGFLLLDWWQHR